MGHLLVVAVGHLEGLIVAQNHTSYAATPVSMCGLMVVTQLKVPISN